MVHEHLDIVSLEMARRVADQLHSSPQILDRARENLRRWSNRNADSPSLLRCYAEWASLLELPIGEICAILTSQTDEGQRLRQNSPFAGVLPPAEVWAIKKRFRQHEALPA